MTQTVLLGDIATINMGQSPKSEFYNFVGDGLPFMQGVRTFGRMYPTIDTWCNNPIKIADKGDILFSVRAPVGDLNFATERMCIGRGLASLKSRNNKFLFYVLEANKDRLVSSQTGSVFGSVNAGILKNFKLTIPESVEKQDEIASILGSLDEKIELNRKMNETLEQMGQALFRRYFINNPESQMVNIEKVANLERGVEPGSRNYKLKQDYNSVSFLRVGDLSQRVSNLFIDKSLTKSKIANFDDVLVSFDGAPGLVGVGLNGCYSSGIRKISPRDTKVSNAYLYFLIKSQETQDIIDRYSEGTTIKHASKSINYINAYIINDISKLTILDCFFDEIISNILENNNLIQIRDSLLPRLINRKVKV